MFSVFSLFPLNVVVFRPTGLSDEDVKTVLNNINASGKVYLIPGAWEGKSAIIAAFSNWRTTLEDVKIICNVLESVHSQDKCYPTLFVFEKHPGVMNPIPRYIYPFYPGAIDKTI